ncbi:MAG: hypothetical protein ACRCXZ_04445, partial [Patescibacteria group bacterium]
HMVCLAMFMSFLGVKNYQSLIQLKAIRYVYSVAMLNKPKNIKVSLRIFTIRFIDSFNRFMSDVEGESVHFTDEQYQKMLAISKRNNAIWPFLDESIELSMNAKILPNITRDQLPNFALEEVFPDYHYSFQKMYSSESDCFLISILRLFFDID